ncbi:hypothetical protein [Streptomyces sp. 184]|uniref:hypothetical protein n=1 Tax=Streptomyces sp. 184 TaxID=1827526 RepID=UPI00389156E0
MSAASYLVLRCDAEQLDGTECVAETHWALPVADHRELRKLRRSDGWRARRRPESRGLVDLCPDCDARIYPKPGRMEPEPLTPRQAQVLTAAADGHPLSTVAAWCGITREQAAARLSEAYRRLGVERLPREERRAAAVDEARRRGLIPLAAESPPSAPASLADSRGHRSSQTA